MTSLGTDVMADLKESELWSAEDPEEEAASAPEPGPKASGTALESTESNTSKEDTQASHSMQTNHSSNDNNNNNNNNNHSNSTVQNAPQQTQQQHQEPQQAQSPLPSQGAPGAQSQMSFERRSSRGRLLSKQNEIEEVEDEDHSPSSETSDATVIAAGLETPINDGSPESSPTEKKTADSSPDSDKAQNQGRRASLGKNKILVRSHALRDDSSPPPSEEKPTTAHSGGKAENHQNHSSSPNTLAPTSKSSPRRRLEKNGSQNSDVSGTSPCLSRDSSIETQYTDATGIDLEEFIRSTLANNPKDRIMLLKLELDLTAFIKDPKKDIHKFQSMTSYHRMLVHRVAAFFGLEHNVDQTGKAVIVNKTVNTRIPDFKFRDHIREDSLSLDEPKKLLKRGDSASFEEGKESCSSQDGAVDSPGKEDILWCSDIQPWSSTDSSGYGTDCSSRAHLSMTKASSFGGVTVLSKGERTQRVYKSVSVESKTVGTCTSPCPIPQTLLPPPLEVNPTVLWVALQPEAVPIGSIIINPQTGQPYFNPDGTVYRYSPSLAQQPWHHQHHHHSMASLSSLSPSSSLSSFGSFGSTGQLAVQGSMYTLRPQQAVPRQYSAESNSSHEMSAPFSSLSLTSQSSTDSESNIPPLPPHQFASPQQTQPPQNVQHNIQVAVSQPVPAQVPVSAGQQIVLSAQAGAPYPYPPQPQQQVQFYGTQPSIQTPGGTPQYYLPVQQQPPPQQPPPQQQPPQQPPQQQQPQQPTPENPYPQYQGQYQEGIYYSYNHSPSSEANQSQFYVQVPRSSSAPTPPNQQQPYYPQTVYAQVAQYQTKTPPQGQKQLQALPYQVQRPNSPQVITYQNMTSPTHFPLVRPGVQVAQRTTPPPSLQMPSSGVKIVYDRKDVVICSDGARPPGTATPPIQSPQQPIPTVQLPVRPVGAVPAPPADLRFYGAPIQLRPQIQQLFQPRPTRLAAPVVRQAKPMKNGCGGSGSSSSASSAHSDSSAPISRSSSLGHPKSSPSHDGGEVMNAGQQLLEVYELPSHLKCQDLDVYLECLVVRGAKIHCIPPDEPNRAIGDCVVLLEFSTPHAAQTILASANQAQASGQNTGYKLRPCPQQITPKT